MAACGNFKHIFENPLPENQTLLDSLPSSWSQNVTPVEQTKQTSFSELFDSSQISTNENRKENNKSSRGLSLNHSICNFAMNSESLQFCTEGLGFESLGDTEDLQGKMINEKGKTKEEKIVSTSVDHIVSETSSGEIGRSKMIKRDFPPPISVIGKSGQRGVCFKSYRQDGRFVLKEVRIPKQEFLQARREDGRLKLQIIQPSNVVEDEDEDEGDEDSEKDEQDNVSDVRDNVEA